MIHSEEIQNVALIGINHETAGLLPSLLDSGKVRVVRVLNHREEDLGQLCCCNQLQVIIDASDDPRVAKRLKELPLDGVDVMGALSARILFLTGRDELFRNHNDSERGRILNSLYEIRQAVILSSNKEEMLKLILSLAARAVNADGGSIMLLDAGKRYLKIEMAKGLEPDIVTSAVRKVGKGIAGKVVKTGKPLLLIGKVAVQNDGESERDDISSSICCPLMIDKDPVGALSVHTSEEGKMFDEEDFEYIKMLAAFTAEMVRTTQVYERTVHSTVSLSVLDSARAILALDFPFDERLNLLLLKIVNTFGGEICNYYFYHHDRRAFFVRASSSFRVKLLEGKTLKLNDYLARKLVPGQGTVAVDIPEPGTNLRKWYVVHPVSVSGRMVGALFLHLISERRRLDVETEILKKIGEMLSAELSRHQESEARRLQSTKYSAISESTFDLANATSVEELARAVVTHACLILEAESCVLRLLDPETGTLNVAASFSLADSSHLQQIETLDERISERAREEGDVQIINNVKDMAPAGGPVAGTALSMEMKYRKQVIGTCSVYDKKALDLFGSFNFSETDKEVFLSFCLHAAKAFIRLREPEVQDQYVSEETRFIVDEGCGEE